jgi:beta-lactamase class A
MSRLRLLAFIACCLVALPLRADELADQLKPLIDAHKGHVAVAIKDLKTGKTFEHNADDVMPTASLIKFPLMITAYQQMEDGKLSEDDKITLKKDDKVPGSGILTDHFSDGVTMTLGTRFTS